MPGTGLLFLPVALLQNVSGLPSDPPPPMGRDDLFSSQVVHEIEIELPYSAWYDTLVARRQAGTDTYVPGTVRIDGVAMDSVGVRFKGGSSYVRMPTRKKPFRLKFDEFVEGRLFAEADGISMANSFDDPTFMREPLTYDLLRHVGRATLSGFGNVTVNGELMGLYVLNEPINRLWTQNHVGGGEDGNLWKALPHASYLTWQGPAPEAYKDSYSLQTNRSADDWTDLVDFIDALNNTPIPQLADSLEARLDVDAFLREEAVTITAADLDSYVGSGNNYYLYHRDDEDRLLHLSWDMNFSFGRYGGEARLSPEEILALSPLWAPENRRPLVHQILSVPVYQRAYLRHVQRLVNTVWVESEMNSRIDALRDLIAPHVYADPYKQYSNADFDRSIDEDIWIGPSRILGLRSFVHKRRHKLRLHLDELIGEQRLFLNELVANNRTLIQDDAGDFDDYVEIHHSGPGATDLSGYGLTDNILEPFRWILPPEARVPAGGHLLLWLDGEADEGPLHGPFSLDADGEGLYLFTPDGALVDLLVFEAQWPDVAHGRRGDGSDWIGAVVASPGASNPTNAPPILTKSTRIPLFPGPRIAPLIDVEFEDANGDSVELRLIYDADGGDVELPLDPSTGASIPGFAPGTLVRYFLEADDGRGGTTRRPAGAPAERFEYTVTVGIAPIAINEFMADNASTLTDERGEYEDWIELANISSADVDLSGFHLSDDPADPTQWAFEEGTLLEAGERLLVWADDDPGDLHANFKLGKGGEFVGLYGPGGREVLDSLSFGEQSTDLTEARQPDGLGPWDGPSEPSPLASNGGGLVALVTADDPPIVIPGSGGSFTVEAALFNRHGDPQTIEAWTVGVTPGGEKLLLGPSGVTLPGERHGSLRISQSVPATIPTGNYVFELRSGQFPDDVQTSDGVPVIKSP